MRMKRRVEDILGGLRVTFLLFLGVRAHSGPPFSKARCVSIPVRCPRPGTLAFGLRGVERRGPSCKLSLRSFWSRRRRSFSSLPTDLPDPMRALLLGRGGLLLILALEWMFLYSPPPSPVEMNHSPPSSSPLAGLMGEGSPGSATEALLG